MKKRSHFPGDRYYPNPNKIMLVMTKERPILFSGLMVRAILANQKTQTRRIIKPQPDLCHGCQSCEFKGNHFTIEPKQVYAKGDQLWVRELWRKDDGGSYLYAADLEKSLGPWKSPIFMPKEASRLTLEITEVHIERLQEISEEDVIREGVKPLNDVDGNNRYTLSVENTTYNARTAKEVFTMLWTDINGEGGWGLNPWCRVISFSVINK